jgi:hypothetical protein
MVMSAFQALTRAFGYWTRGDALAALVLAPGYHIPGLWRSSIFRAFGARAYSAPLALEPLTSVRRKFERGHLVIVADEEDVAD